MMTEGEPSGEPSARPKRTTAALWRIVLPWAQPCIAAGEYAGVCFDRLFAAGLEGSVPRDDANFTQLLPVQALRKDFTPLQAVECL